MKTSIQRASWFFAFLSPASLYFANCKLDVVWLFLSIQLVLLAFPPSKNLFSRIGVPFLLFTILGLFLYYLSEGIAPSLAQASRNLILLASFIVLFSLRIFFSFFGQISLFCAITFQVIVLSLLSSKELFLVYYLPIYFFLAWYFLLHFYLFKQQKTFSHNKDLLQQSFIFRFNTPPSLGLFSLGTALFICSFSMFLFLVLPRIPPIQLNANLVFPSIDPNSNLPKHITTSIFPPNDTSPVSYPATIDLNTETPSESSVDQSVALRLQLLNERGHTFRLNQSIYLRGNVFEIYSQDRWISGERAFQSLRDSDDGRLDRKIRTSIPLKKERALVTQSITLYPHLSKVCFAIADPIELEWISSISEDQGLLEFSSEIASSIDYQVKSSFQPVNPSRIPKNPDRKTYSHLLQISESTPVILKKIAEEVTASCQTDEERIQKILDYFQKQFSYELSPKLTSKNVSEIEYFVTQSRKGNCTHFATAMVLMLRSLKIPARVVGGYAFGDWKEIGEYYEFLRKHAHAWIEIPFENEGFIGFDSTPVQPLALPENSRNLTSSPESRSSSKKLSKTLADWTVAYDQKIQEKLWSLIAFPFFVLAKTDTHRLETGILAIALLCFLGWCLTCFEQWPSWDFLKTRMMLRYSKTWGIPSKNNFQPKPIVPEMMASVYHEYLRLLARHGYRRLLAQTPEEFLASLPSELQSFLKSPTHLFQQSFYGDCALSPKDVEICVVRIKRLKQHFGKK